MVALFFAPVALVIEHSRPSFGKACPHFPRPVAGAEIILLHREEGSPEEDVGRFLTNGTAEMGIIR
jgi:hypothetical protein